MGKSGSARAKAGGLDMGSLPPPIETGLVASLHMNRCRVVTV
jgi:hypothetical protein